MLQLLGLFSLVIGSYAALTLLALRVPTLTQAWRGRISLASFFVVTGLSHFVMPEAMAQMLPQTIPYRVEIIYVTGVLEVLGAVGLLLPQLARIASIALILFLLGVLPANIYAAINYVEFGAHAEGPIYLLARVPFQLFLVGWAYYFGIRKTLPYNRSSLRYVWLER